MDSVDDYAEDKRTKSVNASVLPFFVNKVATPVAVSLSLHDRDGDYSTNEGFQLGIGGSLGANFVSLTTNSKSIEYATIAKEGKFSPEFTIFNNSSNKTSPSVSKPCSIKAAPKEPGYFMGGSSSGHYVNMGGSGQMWVYD